jgi:GNAT superfamily N-acetyltransferase
MQELKLTRLNRLILSRVYQNHEPVDLTIRSIVEGQHGKAFVDSDKDPSVYQIRQGDFCILAGDSNKPEAIEMVKKLPKGMTILPSPEGWIAQAKNIYKDKLKEYQIYVFSSQNLSLLRLKKMIAQSEYKKNIVRIDETFANYLEKDPRHGTYFSNYTSVDDFLQRGIGYCCREENNIIGAVSSALVCSAGIEVNIFVLPEFRKKGIGTVLAAYLLESCLENKVDPHWAASNWVSYKLAVKLGYVLSGTYVAYLIT